MQIGNIKKDNYLIEIKHNEEDDFEQCLVVNGLYIRNGGTIINYILEKTIPKMRDKLQRKYKTIKTGDIKNKIKMVVFIRFFPNLEFTSQEKIEVSNSYKDITTFFERTKIDWNKVTEALLKDQDLILAITEYFNLKEKAKENAELKKLEKKKKIKSEKYYPATDISRNLFLAEGASASGLLIATLGRKANAFYELKGVPLNAWEITASKLNQNKELSELYQILKNNNEEYIPEGDWYEIEINGEIIQVNEYDEIKIDGKWVEIKELI